MQLKFLVLGLDAEEMMKGARNDSDFTSRHAEGVCNAARSMRAIGLVLCLVFAPGF